MIVRLLVQNGVHQGMAFKLPPTQFIIGRDPTCHLRPASHDVSRFHCAIARSGSQVLIRDLKSTNGTFLNDQRIKGTARIAPGDVLRIGPLSFQFEFFAEPATMPSLEDSGLGIFDRLPNEQEQDALDSSSDTQILSFPAASGPHETNVKQAAREEHASAVAGEFLREYLEHRRQSCQHAASPHPSSPEEA